MHRREFIRASASAALAWPFAAQAQQPAQREGAMTTNATLKRARTKTLEIAYEESGPASGTAVLLMHGFPYDVRAYDEVAPRLSAPLVGYTTGAAAPPAWPRRCGPSVRAAW